ncbi:MAG: PAS domain-containing protein [Kofleriaceae bacterium]|nr:PAS domain-containing protein [Kofleriaceae bacterium]
MWEPDARTAWSAGMYRLHGFAPGERFTTDEFFQRIHPDDVTGVAMARHLAEASDPPPPYAYRVVLPDGTTEWLVGHGVAERGADGRVRRFVGTMSRVTDSHRTSELLAQANAMLAETQRAAGVGSHVFDLGTGRLEWSDELYRILGVEPGTPPDVAMSDAVTHPDDVARQHDWGLRVANGELLPPLLVRIVRRDGRTIHLESRARRVDDDAGSRVVGVSMDVTARVELEQELRHAAKMDAIGTLAAGVAHDFNNYLTVLGAQLDLIRRRGGAAPAADLDTMGAAIDRCAGLVRQLLAFARKHPFRPRRIDLANQLDEVLHLFTRVAGHQLTVEVTSEARPLVHADPTQLDGAFMNLLVNARDAMNGAGTLRVTLTEIDLAADDARLEADCQPGRYAWLRIADAGRGIAPDVLPRIFEPYFTTRAGEGGTGLGLAAVYGTVRQHGGVVQIVSDLGRGTTVDVYLPVISGDPPRTSPRDSAPPPQPALRILLVDDLPPVRHALARLLRSEGHTVETAEDGVDALERLAADAAAGGAFELVISDIAMPRLDGRGLARALADAGNPVPVVLMTGYAAGEHRRGDGPPVLDKPFSREDLLRVISQLVRR